MTDRQEVVVANFERYLAEKWDALLEVMRGRVERIWKAGPGQKQCLSAVEVEEFRGCVSALTFFKGNQSILAAKAKDLLAVVGDICAYSQSNVGTVHHSLAALLEVFIKEALVHPPLKCLLYPSRLRIGKISGALSIREVLLAHLSMSIPQEICMNFTDSFCRSLVMFNATNDGSSEIGLRLGLHPALSLLNSSLSSSMPYLLQAHMAILASRCIETHNLEQHTGLGFNDAISAVELSAKLHWRSLCDLNLGERSRPYLARNAKRSVPNQALGLNMNEMIVLQSNRSGKVAQKDLFLLVSSYIDETQRNVHQSSRLRTGTTLKGIVSILLADKELGNKPLSGCRISEELVSVAASARLMASSLFCVIAEARTMVGNAQKYGRKKEDLELEAQLMSYLDLKTSARFHLVGSNADQAARRILLDAISVGSSSRKRSVLMMQHFLKLMLLGLRSRIDFLWKACVLVLSAILDLMAFEGEKFDALKILAGDAHEPVETTKGSTCKRKSKGKQLDSSVLPDTKRRCFVDGDSVDSEGSHQSKDNMCGNQVRTKKWSPEIGACLSDNRDLIDFYTNTPDDLVDFIDFSDDMDLAFWLKEREGLFKERQAAHNRKKKMLRKVLGTI